jgi:hypothetical protein
MVVTSFRGVRAARLAGWERDVAALEAVIVSWTFTGMELGITNGVVYRRDNKRPNFGKEMPDAN